MGTSATSGSAGARSATARNGAEMAADPDADGVTRIAGWGRTAATGARMLHPNGPAGVRAAVAAQAPGGRGLIARGLGRSYGDPAQNAGGTVVDMTGMDQFWLDRESGLLTAEAGVSLDDLLRHSIPRGYFVPVTPGTRFVTLGGCVGADVHGKNHHVDGSFGNHVKSLDLIDGRGELQTLRPNGTADEAIRFWATVGGMGHTGIVTKVRLQMLPITSSRIAVDTDRFESLDVLMDRMNATDDQYRYSVAWLDSVNGRTDFRSVLTCGDHAPASSLPAKARRDPLAYRAGVAVSTAWNAPAALLNRATISAFNTAWYRKAPARARGEFHSIPSFFHPLDLVAGWNRVYGKRGFLQYQFAVPDSAADLVGWSLSALRRAGAPSFLTVLKRFGPGNPAPLSFPTPGWTLAIDLPTDVPGLARTLDRLDEAVIGAGGRHYLAKDSRMRPDILRAGYPRLDDWLAVTRDMDPDGVFTSDQFRRLLP